MLPMSVDTFLSLRTSGQARMLGWAGSHGRDALMSLTLWFPDPCLLCGAFLGHIRKQPWLLLCEPARIPTLLALTGKMLTIQITSLNPLISYIPLHHGINHGMLWIYNKPQWRFISFFAPLYTLGASYPTGIRFWLLDWASKWMIFETPVKGG